MDGRAMGNAVGVDSSRGGHGGGRGVTDPSASAEFGETNESTGYDNMTDTFPEDEREETDDALPTEGMNKTIGVLPNINAVTAANMQPILRTVSTINKSLLRYDLRNCLR